MLLLDENIKVYRLEQVSGNKSSYATVTVSLESTKQPLSETKTGMYGGSYGKMFKFYLDVAVDIREGDRVQDYQGNMYEVVSGGIEHRTDGFIADYLGVVVQKIN